MSKLSISGLLSALTTPKGALLITPAIVGIGVLLSLADPAVSNSGATIAGAVDRTATLRPGDNQQPTEQQPTEQPAALIKVSERGSFSEAQRREIGKIVRDYLLENPEVLQEVSEELAKRQRARQDEQRLKILTSNKNEIFNSDIDYVLGDGDTNVTVIEYFDYNCGWCKRALSEVMKLIRSDPKIKFVMKEFPIFGEHSEFAARAALASKPQGKYWAFHVALMKERRVTKDNVFAIAKRVGIDVERLKVEMKDPKYAEAIETTQRIAASLGIEGTPGFIIDNRINPGYVPAEQLKEMVDAVRKKGCQFC